MATFTTQQATDYLRECLARPINPMPFLVIAGANASQRFEEIETRLQGHFGFHDHAPSLRIIARDSVCNLVLERIRAEQRENLKGWIRRGREAAARYDAKRYDYCEVQPENDGVSLAATDDEVNTLMAEHGFTADDVDQIEAELDAEDAAKKAKKPRGARRARVEPEPTKLVEVAAEKLARDFSIRIKAVVTLSAACTSCEMEIATSRQDSTAFVEMLIKAGWTTCEGGFTCRSCLYSAPADPAPGATVTCQKCGGDVAGPLIAVDREDFDVRFWNGEEWIADPNKKVARLICAGCCRG